MAIQTIEITNFGGRLTRLLNGDMNSGMAKFANSFGYDPFTKPQNLTWLDSPTDITGPISDLIIAAKPRNESNITYIYALGKTGKLYKIQTNSATSATIDSVIAIGSVAASGASFTFGGSIEFFGDTEKIYIGCDGQINTTDFTFGGDVLVGTKNSYAANRFRPLKTFLGKLFFANGQTVASIDSTNTVTSSVVGINGANVYSDLIPALPSETIVQDIDVSIDGNYLLILAGNIQNEQVADVAYDRRIASDVNSSLFRFNGTDKTVTSYTSLPGNLSTSFITYLGQNIYFSNDFLGTTVGDGTNKILSLPNNKSPLPYSTLVSGNLISWIAPEVIGTAMKASMYYFGSLDGENPPGLYRVMKYSTALASGFTYQTPINILANNSYASVNNAVTAVTRFGWGKHYFSTYDVNSGTPGSDSFKLWSFTITPTGSGTPQLGNYETQTQLFSKKITVKQVRVYTEPTATGNGFQLDFIGSDGTVITPTNGVFTYTFAAGTDVTKIQGAVERIDYNPTMKNTYALGIRITNTGTTNMTIKKVEIDYDDSGK